MDEYLLEINQLRRRIARLKFERAPLAIIEELEAQLRILRAIYDSTWALFGAGEANPHLRARFRAQDLGDWTFENVYFYVYEEAVRLDAEGHDLAARILRHDFQAPLLAQERTDAAAGA